MIFSRKILLLLTSPLILISCSSIKHRSYTPPEQKTDELINNTLEDYSVIESSTTEERTLEVTDKKISDDKYLLLPKPKDLNKKIKKWINYYANKDHERFQRFLNRGAKYKEVIEDLLLENNLPPDLYYLGIIESGYVTKAVSHAGAVGPWQFMRPTAKEYGLRVNYYVDERQDPIRSTEAAIKYLRWLYNLKGSWDLALAAYNAGPGRVKSAMRRGRSTDYWNLTRRKLLPRDTREYVAQFLAALTIGRNLEQFGFHEQSEINYPDVELVTVPSPVHLKDVATISGTSLELLKQVNPHLTHGVTPPELKNYDLWIPQESAKSFSKLNSQLKLAVVKNLKPRRYLAESSTTIHRVRRGQTLGHIARKHGLSVAYIKKINGLRSSRIYAGQRLRVQSRQYKRSGTYHIVRRGQTLGGIANRYGFSLRSLKQLNGLSSSKITVGQKLRVKSRNIASAKKSNSKVVRYKVRRGDSLHKIANSFGTSIVTLKKMNDINGSRIYPGQFLKVARNN